MSKQKRKDCDEFCFEVIERFLLGKKISGTCYVFRIRDSYNHEARIRKVISNALGDLVDIYVEEVWGEYFCIRVVGRNCRD